MSSTSSHESNVPVEPQSGYAGSHRVDIDDDSEAAPAAVAAEDVVVIEPNEPADSSEPDPADERGAMPATIWTPGVPSASVPADATAQEPDDSQEPGVADAPGSGAEQWSDIKAMFVDDPGESVKLASELVERAMENLMNALRQRQDALASWQVDDSADTEELRKALRSYQRLFDQLDGVSGQFLAGHDRVTGG